MSNQIRGEFEPQLSAFNGHPITGVDGVPADVAQKLQALGVTDVEQLVALAANPSTRYELAQYLELPEAELNNLLDRAGAALPRQLSGALGEPLEPGFG